MAQLKTAQFQVHPLGGIDLRWRPSVQGQLNANAATLVKDMTWDDRGGWKDAGGYRVIRRYTPDPGSGAGSGDTSLPSLPGAPAEAYRDGGSGGPNS